MLILRSLSLLVVSMKKSTASFIYENRLLSAMKEFTVIIEKGEDGYLISEVVELPGCHTQAKSYDELMKRTREAILLHLECQEEPFEIREKFIGLQKIAV